MSLVSLFEDLAFCSILVILQLTCIASSADRLQSKIHNKHANFSNIGARKMELSTFAGREDGKCNVVGFVEVSNLSNWIFLWNDTIYQIIV